MAFEGFIETACTKQREKVTWNLCSRAAQDELKINGLKEGTRNKNHLSRIICFVVCPCVNKTGRFNKGAILKSLKSEVIIFSFFSLRGAAGGDSSTTTG